MKEKLTLRVDADADCAGLIVECAPHSSRTVRSSGATGCFANPVSNPQGGHDEKITCDPWGHPFPRGAQMEDDVDA